MQTVTIIGAGPAGLTAAYFLSQKNIRPVIFESSKQVGGLGGSVNFWGRSFDIGPHIFLASSQPEAVKFWKEIGGDDLLTITLSRGMVVKQNLISFPPKPMGLLKAFGFMNMSIAAVSVLIARSNGQKRSANAGDFFKNKYGKYFQQNVFDPFCQKYMGINDSSTDLDFATGLTSFVKESGKIDVNTNENELKTLIYPKQGTKIMWTRIAEKVLTKGEIHFEKKLTGIITDKNKIIKLCFSDGSETKPQFVISTLPVVVLINLLDHKPQFLIEELKNISYRNTVLVYLKIDAIAFNHQYITVFDNSIEAGRISNFNAWNNNPVKTETVLCVEYWCNTNDANWNLPNEKIITKAIGELQKLNILDPEKVTGAEVVKVPHSHPTLSIKHINSLAAINKFLASFENLALAGRHATFKWDGQADNIIAGMQLAEKIEKIL